MHPQDITQNKKIKEILQPVVLGGDIGAYSLARNFWEAYGLTSVVMPVVATGIVNHSRFIDHREEANMSDDDVLVAKLNEIAQEFKGKQLLVIGSADRHVTRLVNNRDRIDSSFIIPYVDKKVLERATSKASFSRLCVELDLPHPQTLVVDIDDEPQRPDLSGFTFPIIGKAGAVTMSSEHEFAGKRKVYEFQSKEHAYGILDKIRESGYRAEFIMQERIPGNDSQMRIMTCYCDKDSNVVSSCFGTVLLEEHGAGAVGNPAAIVTGIDEEILDSVKKILNELGWVGYANFDIKVDPRDGKSHIFELNPRLGRSNYYITTSGWNPVRNYVDEWVLGRSPEPVAPTEEYLYTVIPKTLLKRYIFDPKMKQKVQELIRKKRFRNPLICSDEKNLKRWFYILENQLNQWRKFRKYYPVATARELNVTS